MTFDDELKNARTYLKPKPFLHLDEWADKYRYLSPESSAEPGRWRTDNIGVARFPMRAITDPRVREITVASCTQFLKTELILNTIGYYSHWEPSSIINMLPDLDLAEAMSRERVKPMFRDSPELRKLVGNLDEDGTRRVGLNKNVDKVRSMSFKGGALNFIGANSPAALAMRPVRVVLADEIDKYKSDVGRKGRGEGSPLEVLQERSGTFKNRKLVNVCSPTVDGHSAIMKKYEQSNKCIPLARCLHCDEYNDMQFFPSTKRKADGSEVTGGVLWPEGQPEEALYHCTECGTAWQEYERQESILYKNLKLYVGAPHVVDHFGFIASKLYSKWEPMKTLARKFLAAKDDPESLKVFYNTSLAKTFKEQGDAPAWKMLKARGDNSEYKRGTIPSKQCLALVAAIDVQKGKNARLEASVYAVGDRMQTWLIDHEEFVGDTGDHQSAAWMEAKKMTERQYSTPSGSKLSIEACAVDSGDQTHVVYQWAMDLPNVYVVKGDTIKQAIGRARAMDIKSDGMGVIKNGIKLWSVGSSFLKKEQFGWMKKEIDEESGEVPYGYVNFPNDLDETFYRGLTNEVMILKTIKGYSHEVWEKIGANEPLDIRCYCRAMIERLGYTRMNDEEWSEKYESVNMPRVEREKAAQAEQAAPRRRRSSFWNKE